jgi:hypothetical protein
LAKLFFSFPFSYHPPANSGSTKKCPLVDWFLCKKLSRKIAVISYRRRRREEGGGRMQEGGVQLRPK